MVLLDDLSLYRYAHAISPYNAGVVTINHGEMSINWLNESSLNV